MIKLAGRPFDGAEDDLPVDETVFSLDDFEVDYPLEEAVEEPSMPLPESIIQDCRAFFAPDGPLHRAGFDGRPAEERPQQTQMAAAIAEALVKGENLCVEAPTGVGKSFAYLIPLLYRALVSRRPSVVATETINLQQQLIEKDLPILAKLTGIEFKAALAKGRRNYLCRRRFSMLSGDQKDILLPNPSLVLDLYHLGEKLDEETEGTQEDFNLRIDNSVWNLVCCEPGNCLGPKCPYFRNCFYYRARRRWEEAHIIIANHALFFTDLAMHGALEQESTEGSLLPNYGAVVIDEAHVLENSAADHLGLHISRNGVVSLLNRLYNPDSARGLLLRPGVGTMELRGAAAAARNEAYGFFAPYEDFLADRRETAAEIPRQCEFPDRLTPALLELGRLLQDQVDLEEDDSFRTELSSQLCRCREYIDGLENFTGQRLPDAVYYAESDQNALTLHAAPLNVAELLEKLLFKQDFPVILCSATLTVRNRFDYFCGRTGFTGGRTLKLDSPFSPDQAQIRISSRMPDPASSEFIPALVEEIPRYVDLTDGKAFVLFTSYQALRSCAAELRQPFALRAWRLLVQGEEMSRYRLLQTFKEDVNSVLFGTDSFWTGVDVPGEALSNVILTRLPFASPGHPLTAARMRRIEAAGRSSFSEYSLPEAVLKFRQGAGRLIRSRSDRGVIVLLDRRVITKSYGRVFLESLPYKIVVE